MCRLSIIIPLLDDNQAFEDTLVSVLQNRPPDCEVVVAHRGTYEDPYDLSEEIRFVSVDCSAGLIETLNRGLEASVGEIVHLLKPGVLAESGWTDAVLPRFDDPDIAAVSPIILDTAAPRRIASAGLRYTRGGRRVVHGAGKRMAKAKRVLRAATLGPSLDAAFYRSDIVDALGGLCPHAGDTHADIDLALSLRSLGLQSVIEPEAILMGTVEKAGESSEFQAGRAAERVFWRHRGQRSGATDLILHTVGILARWMRGIHRGGSYAHVGGRLLGMVDRKNCRRQHERLERANESLTEVMNSDEDTPHSFLMDHYRHRRAA